MVFPVHSISKAAEYHRKTWKNFGFEQQEQPDSWEIDLRDKGNSNAWFVEV